MTPTNLAVLIAAVLLAFFLRHQFTRPAETGPANATLLIIRHAEKPPPENGQTGLSPAGEIRAQKYAGYFRTAALNDKPIDVLIATADTARSARPRLTLEPLSAATGLKIQQPFTDDEVKDLARWLKDNASNHTALISWHHGKLPKLLRRLGADPAELLPGGEWPDDVFDWVIKLTYDGSGGLTEARRIVEPAFP